MLDNELVEILVKYTSREISCDDLEEWLVAVDLGDPLLSDEDREAVGTLRVLCLEVGEGIRDEEDVRRSTLEILSPSTIVWKEEPAYTTSQSAAITEQFTESPIRFSEWQAPTQPLSASETVRQEAAFAGR